MVMRKFRLSLFARAFALIPLMPLGAGAEAIPLSDLSSYINGLKTAQAKFTQINSDGSLSTGTLYLKRPGRARFEYDPPNDALVIAGGSQLAIFDAKSNQPPEQYPLKKTPLNLILKRNANLAKSGMVAGHFEDGAATVVAARDPDHPDQGTIELYFTGDPIALRKWIITDAGGTQTAVVLNGLTEGVELGSLLFNIPFEVESRRK